MKNLKRAERRKNSRKKLLRRSKNWIVHLEFENHLEHIEKVIKGEEYLWLRTTGKPCSCYNCSALFKYRTYKAKHKRDSKKEIEQQLFERSL